MNLKLVQGSYTDLDKLYKDLLNQFPKNELKSYNTFQTLLENNIYNLLLFNDGTQNIGYVIFIEHNKYLWVEYIAVKREHHSKGYGSEIFNSLKQHFKSKLKGCFLEVEKPDLQNQNTLRRIKFYKKLGVEKILSDYLYPAENNSSLKMDLYFLPFEDCIMPSTSDIKNIIKYIFNSVHYDIADKQGILNEICFKVDNIKSLDNDI